MPTVQYRVVLGKKDERVEGPDDADVVISVALKDAALDPVVAFMSGRLKATGHTGSCSTRCGPARPARSSPASRPADPSGRTTVRP